MLHPYEFCNGARGVSFRNCQSFQLLSLNERPRHDGVSRRNPPCRRPYHRHDCAKEAAKLLRRPFEGFCGWLQSLPFSRVPTQSFFDHFRLFHVETFHCGPVFPREPFAYAPVASWPLANFTSTSRRSSSDTL